MNTKTSFRVRPNMASTGRSLTSLEGQVGPFQTVVTRVHQSTVAGKAQRRVNKGKIEAAERLQEKAIMLAEKQASKALVDSTLSELSALQASIQAKSNAAQQVITNGLMAEMGSHLMNRGENEEFVTSLVEQGIADEQAATALREVADACFRKDMAISRAVAEEMKDDLVDVVRLSTKG